MTSDQRPSKTRNDLGVSVDLVAADVRKLIARHGVKAVQEAISLQTKRPRGRPASKDWYLSELLKPDAERWLQNIEPFAVETNNAIANKAVAIYPDRNSNILPNSQKTRILNRLRERRYYYTLVLAWHLSHEDYSYLENLRAVNALIETGVLESIWQKALTLARERIELYRVKFGEPAAALTMREIEKSSMQSVSSSLGENIPRIVSASLSIDSA